MSDGDKRVKMETSTIVDAIQRAARVAPTRGAALEKAAGIVIRCNVAATGDPLTIMSTDLDLSFMTTVSAIDIGTDDFEWRLPATLLSGWMNTLDLSSGSEIEMFQHGNEVRFKSGKAKAKFNMIQGGYPIIPSFDPKLHSKASGLATRLKQVAWAVNTKSVDILSGVNLDGEYLYGCDRTRLAVVPCEVPVDRPVTAQLTSIAPSLRNTSEVGVRATETRLELSPDDHTQITSRLIEGDYPDVSRLMRDDYSGEVTIQVDVLNAVLDRMSVIAKNERSTATSIVISNGSMSMMMQSKDVGMVADEFDVIGGEKGESFKMKFDSDSLRRAVMASGRPQVKLRYGPVNTKPIELSDDTDFRSVLMPMRPDS